MFLSFILFACGLACLVLFLCFRDKNSSTVSVCLKTGTSVFFVATAVSSIAFNSEFNSVEFIVPCLLFLFGLVMGLIGDITLDFKIYFKSFENLKEEFPKDKDRMMWIGMIAFGIGHISYISALAMIFTEAAELLWLACIIAIVLISLVFLVSTKVLKMNFGKFFVPCYIYGFLLSAFVAFSLIAMITDPSACTVLLFIGSVLFIVSDLVLSMTYFSKEEDYKKEGILNPESKFMIVINHVTYYLAQFAIALALLFI